MRVQTTNRVGVGKHKLPDFGGDMVKVKVVRRQVGNNVVVVNKAIGTGHCNK
jgi:hypothetical protein